MCTLIKSLAKQRKEKMKTTRYQSKKFFFCVSGAALPYFSQFIFIIMRDILCKTIHLERKNGEK